MKAILQFLFCMCCFTTMAQAPSIQWQHTFGENYLNQAITVQLSNHGGYIVGGGWFGTECGAGVGSLNGAVLKLDEEGNLIWHTCLEFPGFDATISTQSVPGGGYIALSATDYYAYDFITDPQIMRISEAGLVEWSHVLPGYNAFGVLNVDYFPGNPPSGVIKNTSDGGFLLIGNKDPDFFAVNNRTNCTVTKLNSLGIVQWEAAFGGTNDEVASSAQSTPDGNYIFAGATNSNNDIYSDNHGALDFLVVKFNQTGGLIWKKCLGGSQNEMANTIVATLDGGYVVAGYTQSNNGNVSGNHGGQDGWIVKLDSAGTIQWQKCLGGTGNDIASSIQLTSDGGYIVAGSTNSIDGDVSGNHGGFDVWVVELDANGNVIWQKCLGGSNNDFGNAIQLTVDDGYIIAGETYSFDGDVTSLTGTSNMWVVKLTDEALSSTDLNNSEILYYPNPTDEMLYFTKPIESVSVYTINGQKLCEGNNLQHIDLRNLSSGIYFLKLEMDGKSKVSKILKN